HLSATHRISPLASLQNANGSPRSVNVVGAVPSTSDVNATGYQCDRHSNPPEASTARSATTTAAAPKKLCCACPETKAARDAWRKNIERVCATPGSTSRGATRAGWRPVKVCARARGDGGDVARAL
ncbi:hypothetical protein BE221DRAFT_66293, partial [Ostreococcus tauri]